LPSYRASSLKRGTRRHWPRIPFLGAFGPRDPSQLPLLGHIFVLDTTCAPWILNAITTHFVDDEFGGEIVDLIVPRKGISKGCSDTNVGLVMSGMRHEEHVVEEIPVCRSSVRYDIGFSETTGGFSRNDMIDLAENEAVVSEPVLFNKRGKISPLDAYRCLRSGS
jgi:hypothetical protein